MVGNITYFYEEEEIRVLALWGRPRPLLDMVAGDIDTLEKIEHRARNSKWGPTILESYS